ncbi:MAG: hypothetical protein J6N18_09510 [Kiritimatiellae bacterium]|nr:hypothetical protein [Kiritimatiellia bacterium]
MKRRNILSVLLATCSVASFADTTGVLSEDGRVLTVNVSGQEGFNPELISETVAELVKTGDGVLTVSADMSSWNGDITIAAGTYVAKTPSALGDVTYGNGGIVEVKDGATLELAGDGTRFTMPKKSFIIGGKGVSGRGAVVYSGSGVFDKVSLGNDITLSTDALVSVEGDFHVYWNNSPTYIRVNGHILTLKPYKSRSFILGYANTPDPQGGRIVIDGNTLTFMNPNAAVVGNGTVSAMNSAVFDLSSMYGSFDWNVEMNSGSSIRTKAKIDSGEVVTNINVVGGSVSLPEDVTTVHFGYDQNPGGSISIRGKVSGGGFLLTRDSRVEDAQFHLFNSGNEFADGVSAASGIDVYLWSNGALPPDGGAISMNSGNLFLKAPWFSLPGAVFSGECSVVGGIGCWNASVEKSGDGVLQYRSAVDGERLDVKGGMVRFDPANRAKIAGLYEGCYAYKKNTRPDYTDFFKGKNFPTNSIAAGTRCSYDSENALWKFPDVAGSDTRAVIAYKGYIWNNSSEPVTWAFAGSDASTVYLEIGGTKVYEQQYNISGIKYIGHGTATLQPGANTFLYVVYAGGLTGTPNSWFSDGSVAAEGNWNKNFGIGVNKSGNDSLLVADYEPLMDPGDGSLFTYALPGQSDIVRPGVETLPSDVNGVLPNFDEMSFAVGTGMDFGGVPSYCIDILEGLPSIDGLDQLTIASEWKLDVTCFGGDARLITDGELKLEDGLKLTISSSHRFGTVSEERRYPIAGATGGVQLGDIEIVSDSDSRKFELAVSDDGKLLYLVRKPNGFVLTLH